MYRQCRVQYEWCGCLGSSTVELADETTEVETDMYVKLVNYQEEITPAN